MRILEIQALNNGAHRNQDGGFSTIPEGWAVIPDDMEIPDTFPFVNIEVENGVVISMTAGVMPEPEPEPTPAPTTSERIAALEEQAAQTDELAIELYEANLEQQEINTAQDDALIEIYELIGG